MATEGKDTSEHKMAKASNWINLVLAVLASIMTSLNPDSLAYVIVAGIVAAANAFVTSGYAKSRGIVKANRALGKS